MTPISRACMIGATALALFSGGLCHADGIVAVDPQILAAEGLVGRILPGRETDFRFHLIPSDDGADVFEVSADGGRVTIGGSTGVAMARGLNWYLQRYCYASVSLYGDQLDVPDVLPDVRPAVRRVCADQYRYLLNYCAFGYSLPWWDFEQWERLIDWMALNGINMPLAVTGQEAVWQALGRRIGLTEDEITEFIAGPPYLPFGWMGCLDGYGGPLPQSWIDSHVELQKQILERERSFGMTPVLQGFTGHVPRGVARLYPEVKMHEVHWIEWTTGLLEPTSAAFQEIGTAFLQEQEKLFGTDHLYASDTFIEMSPPSGESDYLASLSKAVLRAMTSVDPEATWVMQGWIIVNNPGFWTEERRHAFFDAVPDDRMVLLDLFCESNPAWSQTEAFYGKPWLWCLVQSFGRVVRLEGSLERINTDLNAARRSPEAGRLSGIGIVNEGLDYNPIVFEFLFEMAWHDGPVDVDEWVKDYAHRRYGVALDEASSAWRRLLRTAYSGNQRTASNVSLRPNVNAGGYAAYDTADLLEAWRELLACSDKLSGVDTYRFDVVNIGRQVLVNAAPRLHADVSRAFKSSDTDALEAASERYVTLLRDIDRLLATREEFLLGRNLEDAKRWGASQSEADRFEWNARNVITLWGETTALNDYARKEWAGLIEGFYLKRWEILVDHMRAALRESREFDASAYFDDIWAFETGWVDGTERYPSVPEGDSIGIVAELLGKYGRTPDPEMPSLTTGKPVTSSGALPPYPAHLANDGMVWNTDAFWAVDVSDGSVAWWQVDLGEATEIGRVVVIGYYGDERYYGFTVETSLDGEAWQMVADIRDNTAPSTQDGYTCDLEPTRARFIRVTQTHNSANTGRHLVEVLAYGPEELSDQDD